MMQETGASVKLNLEGLLCPIPVVRVSQAINDLPAGGILEATATEPGVLTDIVAWVKSTGNELLSVGKKDEIITFTIRKARRPRSLSLWC